MAPMSPEFKCVRRVVRHLSVSRLSPRILTEQRRRCMQALASQHAAFWWPTPSDLEPSRFGLGHTNGSISFAPSLRQGLMWIGMSSKSS